MMTATSVPGNDGGSVAAGILAAGILGFIILGAFGMYAAALTAYASGYERAFITTIETRNRAAEGQHETD